MSERGQNYRATWARWRERNATGRATYEARMESADQCFATCATCWVQCDLPEGHLWRHQFPGQCETVVLDETWTLSPEARRLLGLDEAWQRWAERDVSAGVPIDRAPKIGGSVEVKYVSPKLAEALAEAERACAAEHVHAMRFAREWAREWARDLFGGAE